MARVSHLSSISLTEPPGPGERRKLKGLRKLKVRMFSLVIPPPQIPVPLKVALELAPQAESSGSHGGGGNRRTGIGAPPPPPPPPPPMFGFPFHKRFLVRGARTT